MVDENSQLAFAHAPSMAKRRERTHLYRLRLARSWKFILAVSLLATAIAVLCHKASLLGLPGAEAQAYDDGVAFFTGKSWFPWGAVEQAKDVVVIAIDDRSLQEIRANRSYALNFGSWPYSRNVWAFVFDYLVKQGARAVVLDAVLDEPHTDAANDLAMARSIRELGVPFYMGFNVDAVVGLELPAVEAKNRFPAAPAPPAERAQMRIVPAGADESFPIEEAAEELPAPPAGAQWKEPAELSRREKIARALAFPVTARGLELPALDGLRPIPPIDPLLEPTSGLGLVVPEVDSDGKMRRTRFAYRDGANSYVTLPVAVVADLLGAQKLELGDGQLVLGDKRVPINRDGDAEIDYGGPIEQRFRTVSLVSVLNDRAERELGNTPRLPEGLFKDKVVVIGGFALGTGDQKATPFSSLTPGVAKQASEIQNLLDGRFITLAPFWASVLLALLVSLLSVSLIVILKSTTLEIVWPLLIFFGFFLVTGVLLVVTKVHVLSAMPALAGELASVTAVAFNHLFASRERERIKELFTNYLAKEVVDELVEMPAQKLPKLHGESREVTAFFSDIRGFSTISERYRENPAELVRLLNRYLTVVTEVLYARKGCIDKYVGDAVVALFGAPLKDTPHAAYACLAALEVQEAVDKLGRELAKEGLPELATRVGVNTDTMFVGNMGSDHLLDYTAVGDGMNLAARLEAANKHYKTRVLIGERTYELAQEHVEARELDWVRVPGKNEPVRIYELLTPKGKLAPKKAEAAKRYAQALEHYRARRFSQALNVLGEALEVEPGDGPSTVLRAKCQEYLLQPPPAQWDAVSDVTVK